MVEPESRRPLASRNTNWARATSGWLARTSVTPNQISMASVAFAVMAGVAFYGAGQVGGAARPCLLVLGAVGCQLRLVCNLLDGMVAIEAGKQAKDGPFWNEFPDRVSDVCIFVGIGYGVGFSALGWAAACLSVLTAYTRELGRGIGQPADFSGPMAKPQRMAVVTVAAAVSILEPLWSGYGGVMRMSLWLVCVGAAITTIRRSLHIVAWLKARE